MAKESTQVKTGQSCLWLLWHGWCFAECGWMAEWWPLVLSCILQLSIRIPYNWCNANLTDEARLKIFYQQCNVKIFTFKWTCVKSMCTVPESPLEIKHTVWYILQTERKINLGLMCFMFVHHHTWHAQVWPVLIPHVGQGLNSLP